MKLPPAKEHASQISYGTQVLESDLSVHEKLQEVGSVVWELHKALQSGKVKLIKGNGKKQPPQQMRVV